MARNELMKIPRLGLLSLPEAPGTFLQRFLSGRAGAETGSHCRRSGFLGYYDGSEFRVAVAVSLPTLLYVRLRPREAPMDLLPSPDPRLSPNASNGEGRMDPVATTRSPPTFLPRMLLWQVLPRRPLSPLILRPPLHPAGCSRTWTLGRSSWPPVLAGPVLLPPA